MDAAVSEQQLELGGGQQVKGDDEGCSELLLCCAPAAAAVCAAAPLKEWQKHLASPWLYLLLLLLALRSGCVGTSSGQKMP